MGQKVGIYVSPDLSLRCHHSSTPVNPVSTGLSSHTPVQLLSSSHMTSLALALKDIQSRTHLGKPSNPLLVKRSTAASRHHPPACAYATLSRRAEITLSCKKGRSSEIFHDPVLRLPALLRWPFFLAPMVTPQSDALQCLDAPHKFAQRAPFADTQHLARLIFQSDGGKNEIHIKVESGKVDSEFCGFRVLRACIALRYRASPGTGIKDGVDGVSRHRMRCNEKHSDNCIHRGRGHM